MLSLKTLNFLKKERAMQLSMAELFDRMAHLARKLNIKKEAVKNNDASPELTDKRNSTLQSVIKAIKKIQANPEKYGLCENCKQPISLERLKILPEAEFCFNCQMQKEEVLNGHDR